MTSDTDMSEEDRLRLQQELGAYIPRFPKVDEYGAVLDDGEVGKIKKIPLLKDGTGIDYFHPDAD